MQFTKDCHTAAQGKKLVTMWHGHMEQTVQVLSSHKMPWLWCLVTAGLLASY